MSTKNSNFFSRDCMVQALIQLLKTKSLSNITITELTERAGVSRMTYYRNYHSLDEIFSSYLKDLVDPTVRMLRHGRTRAITMTPAICCIVMNISIITKNSLPVWCRPVWGTCCYSTGRLHSGYLLYRRQGAGFLLHAPSLLRFPLQYLCHLDSGRFQRIR